PGLQNQKLNRPCSSMTLPASAPEALPKSGESTFGEKNPKGTRFSLLNALKKFALNSKKAPSPRCKKLGSPVRLAALRSMEKYFGPRNELRPMPGRNVPPGLF